jgi:hypothetical protein
MQEHHDRWYERLAREGQVFRSEADIERHEEDVVARPKGARS